jgi:hypothetical protein
MTNDESYGLYVTPNGVGVMWYLFSHVISYHQLMSDLLLCFWTLKWVTIRHFYHNGSSHGRHVCVTDKVKFKK